MIKMCDWSKEKVDSERSILQNEYDVLASKSLSELSTQERQRKANLLVRLNLLIAIHFGNPDERVICKKCKNKFAAGYIGNGVILKETCITCHRNPGEESFSSKRVYPTSNKHGASI